MTTCPQCGTQNLPGMAYCEHCGSPLSTPEAAPAAPAAPPAQAADAGAADAIASAQAMLDQLNAADAPADAAAGQAAAAVAPPASDQSQPAQPSAPDSATADPAAASADAGVAPDPAASPPPAVDANAGFPQAAPPVTSGAAVLVITFGDGAAYTMQGDVTNVGRSDVAQNWHPELDVIPYGGGAPDFGVSRHQAVIQRNGSSFTVLDVGSTNGTFVNGHVLEYNKPVELHDGDSLAFGAFNGKISIH